MLNLPTEVVVRAIELSGCNDFESIDSESGQQCNAYSAFRARWELACALRATCSFLRSVVAHWEQSTTCIAIRHLGRVDLRAAVQRFPSVRHLSLWGCDDFASVHELASLCSELEHVNLRDTKVGDKDVSALARCSQLTYVVLWNTKVGDAGVCALSQCCLLYTSDAADE